MNKCLILMLMVVFSGSCETSGSANLNVISAERDAVVVEVHNGTSEEIVLLSPEAPSRQINEEQCVLTISTRVTDDVRPYAFTPTLETVDAGATKCFRAVLKPIALSTHSCTAWTISAEYAYVLPEAVTTFKGRRFEDFRQYALRNQHVIRASAKLPIRTE